MNQCLFTIEQNIIVKRPVPEKGIVCSNPERTLRISSHFLENPCMKIQSWGLGVITGKIVRDGVNEDFFFAYAPMGASGSAMAFHELFAAGAEEIVRLGSNDVWVTEDDMDSLVLISEARGLRGVSWDQGIDEQDVDKPLLADHHLHQRLMESCKLSRFQYSERICFNVDDYHAYLYPERMERPQRIQQRLETYNACAPYCRDMETASLFLKANQFGRKASSVLQNVVKQKDGSPYEGSTGDRAKANEIRIAEIVINAMR
ncbi:uridine phosphorylase [Elysia marginata]|uniref:Uridine phosphorylase n=1 Tax=Elysia marginata TaxID=1093978 RepID=A0AAV4JQK9_9GAST|nr:uridine phosphorylase [Elysia marginata]